MKKYVALFLSLLMLGNSSVLAVNPNLEAAGGEVLSEDQGGDAATYTRFLEQHADAQRPDGKINVDITRYTADGGSVSRVESYLDGDFQVALRSDEKGSVTFEAQVEQPGLYAVMLDYVAEFSRGAAIEREIRINGELQYSEAAGIVLNRIYQNKASEIGLTDVKGNDIRPSQVEVKRWQKTYIKDPQGYFGNALLFYFKEGKNTITLVSKSEPITIGAVTLCNLKDNKEYGEVKAAYVQNRYEPAQVEPILLQGEQAAYKSDPILYPLVDRTSPATMPYEANKQKLNSIGGSKWQEPRQFLTWEFHVDKAGLYTLVFKARQNIARGVTSNRAIYIDDEIPFSELEHYEFKFDTKWQLVTLSKGDTPYQIYLSEGRHEIKMEVTLGKMAEKINEVEEILRELNSIYTKVMIITGSTPDTMRDYTLDKLLPEEIQQMGVLADKLQDVKDWFVEYTGGKGTNDATLNTTITQLKKMSADHEEIPKGLSYFKTNIGALGTWLISIKQQPLELDYIALCSQDNPKLDDPNARFFEQLAFSLNQFVRSFIDDYGSIGSMQGDEPAGNTVKVWLSTGRDQAQVLRKLIDTSFSSQYKQGVKLELVTAGALLPATVAGIGPDVALNMGDAEPVNYAIRNAVINLKQFPDYDEVADRFLRERLTPLSFDGKAYALPETQVFSVLFYRSDVLADLGIAIPNTWEDVISVIPVLQKNNMSFGMPVSSTKMPQAGVNSYYMMLLQRGGQIYQDGAKQSALDSQTGLAAFKQWTNFYVNYGLPQEYDFINRFRTGEYPLIVGDFSNFNSLMVSAPEIRGLWSFTLLPGSKDENGNVDRSMPISGTNCFILKNSKNYTDAWNFIKWWTDAPTQVEFGKEMESVLGASARHPTANLKALEQIPWTSDFYQVLSEQMKWGKGVPQVPGAYFIGRHLDNAFRKVVIAKEDPKETLFDYVYTINQEIKGKRKEFGLD